MAIVEPLKLGAIFIAGSGHWITGLAAIICAYALSLGVVERLFIIVKPKLLTLPWFAAFWTWFVAVRATIFGWLAMAWTLEPKRASRTALKIKPQALHR